MAMRSDMIDLERLGLKSGGGWHDDVLVARHAFVFGEQRYEPDEPESVVGVQVSRTTSGWVVRVRFEATIKGPCMRCFDDQGFTVVVDQTEVHEPQLELDSDYVRDTDFDLAGYVHDTIGLALPQTMSGELDPDGGCLLCGRSRQELQKIGIAEQDGTEGADPRWAKLRELEL